MAKKWFTTLIKKIKGLIRDRSSIALKNYFIKKASKQEPPYQEPNPLANLILKVQEYLHNSSIPEPTGLSKDTYIATIQGIVNFFRQYQSTDGRILDPYAQTEKQYSTPCYSWAATVLIINGYSDNDLLESASKALENSIQQLVDGNAADDHGDFFIFPIMLAYEHLREIVSANRRQKWEDLIRNIDPDRAYWSKLHGGGTNVELSAIVGEFLRYKAGFTDLKYVESNLARQIPLFTPEGLYRDQALTTIPYDNYARHLLSAMLYFGYQGKYQKALEIILDRGSWASLLMQSPWGELPLGSRSSQHQWNEAQLCAIFEIWARREKSQDNIVAAQAFKRGARLALKSVRRWIRPSGEVWIVKNRFDPQQRHGYETYSWHSQYNLWTASALAFAWLFADDSVSEGAAPSDIGGFIAQISPEFHKIFANAGGLYIEIDTKADKLYNSTGLIRIHKAGVDPLVGPSATSDVPGWKNNIQNTALAIGISWPKGKSWESLAQFGGYTFYSILPRSWKPMMQFGRGQVKDMVVDVHEETTQHLNFTVHYHLSSTQVNQVIETYDVTPKQIRVVAKVDGKVDRVKVCFPILVFDGEKETNIDIEGATAKISLGDSQQIFRIESPDRVILNITKAQVYTRNGYLDIVEGQAEGKSIIYTLTPTIN
ncbi:hypothetical protein [Okeania sp. SIO2B3]|uniref:hypothetical protein n=1 Tax=Okeania sp. SIO2B3 TaxID=2607784 RepID=UPI0013C29111|nr:hypothetical protein [Okeania sp. SIO2B3]NET43253.1 hypothetical protein [Okeania sp. SIO2B3]